MVRFGVHEHELMRGSCPVSGSLRSLYDLAMAPSMRTLLFTDIEGSTPLLERAGVAYGPLLNRHRALIRTAIERHDGDERQGEGDSFFVVFGAPTAALQAALEAQLALEREPWPEGFRVRVRMGLHVGEIYEDDGDVVGLAIHHAARIANAAHGGQIVVSEAVQRVVSSLPDGATLRSLGQHRLRDVGMVPVFQIGHPALQREFPPLRGTSGNRTNLPQQRSSFIGTGAVLDAVRSRLTENPMVTLLGPGGVGKTRVATEFGWRHRERFESGVFFVDLAPLTDEGAVAGAMTDVLSIVSGSGGSPLDVLVEWIADRQLLLIVDNCEHLVAEVGTVLATLLAQCPRLQVIATSREVVGIDGESILVVPSLDPETEGVQLFVQRALAADSSFLLDGHRDAVAEICRRLDGIPLAIELAAARVRTFAPVDLLERLQDRFQLLRGSGRGALDRRQTLESMVRWSYQLLSPGEQVLFDRLSVFAGTFTMRAAERVCGAEPIRDRDVVGLLTSLVDKSMVVADRGPAGSRYRLLETLRQFGEDRLVVDGNGRSSKQRHAEYYTGLADELWTLVTSQRQLEGKRAIDLEWDNFRAAHEWWLAEQNLPQAMALVKALHHYAELNMRHEHGVLAERTETLAEALGTPSTEMLAIAADWAEIAGDAQRALHLATRAIELAPAPDHPSTALAWFNVIGACAGVDKDDPEVQVGLLHMRAAVGALADPAREWLSIVNLLDTVTWLHPPSGKEVLFDVLRLADNLKSPRLAGMARIYDGNIRLDFERDSAFAAVADQYGEVLAIARGAEDNQLEGMALRSVAITSAGLAQPDALERCGDAVRFLYDIRYWQKLWQVMDSVAVALVNAGRMSEAATLLGHLDAHIESFGMEHDLDFRQRAHERLTLDDEQRTAAARAGAAMSADELVRTVLDWCAPTPDDRA
jgi:predicted ATPase/class 3 adenylate cyclase